MPRIGALCVSLLLALAGNACSKSGSHLIASGSAGEPGSTGGDGPDSSAMAGGASVPDTEVPGAGAAGDATGGAPSDNPGQVQAGGATGNGDPTEPGYPFETSAAVTALGPSLDVKLEVLDARTTEYTLSGANSNAQLDRTEWSTSPEAEFECSRGANGGTQVVGSDRMLFIASDALWLAAGTACTRVVVSTNSTYSPTLTRSFAQDVLGAP